MFFEIDVILSEFSSLKMRNKKYTHVFGETCVLLWLFLCGKSLTVKKRFYPILMN